MSIKERPLIKAAERLGPLPGVFFSSMIVAGVFAMIMCGVFAAVFTMFQAMARGPIDALLLFDICRGGAMIGMMVGAGVFLIIAVMALIQREELWLRLRFVLGGALALVALALLDWFFLDELRSWIGAFGVIR